MSVCLILLLSNYHYKKYNKALIIIILKIKIILIYVDI